jgi:predicted nucleic acid-binding protein
VKVRHGYLTGSHRADALAVFNEMVEQSFHVLPVARTDYRTAARFADQHATGLRAGDALHLAVTINHGAPMRTLDKTLASAATQLGASCCLL